MTRVQIIEQNGAPAFAVIPIDMWLKLKKSAEDIEDVALYDTAKANDDGFRIPADILTRELEGENSLKLWREHRKLTVEALATAAGISKAYLSQIENGKRHGTLKVMKALARNLDIPLDILVEDENIKLAA
jgi:DNA-binding XRE family transcriptional regulator